MKLLNTWERGIKPVNTLPFSRNTHPSIFSVRLPRSFSSYTPRGISGEGQNANWGSVDGEVGREEMWRGGQREERNVDKVCLTKAINFDVTNSRLRSSHTNEDDIKM
jgi:hypothetical protein